MSQWQLLLDRAVVGLDRLRKADRPVPEWVLGGGTALMLHAGHRLSKDNVAHSKANILARLNGISETFLGLELNELAISQKWQKETDACLARVKAIIASMPEQ